MEAAILSKILTYVGAGAGGSGIIALVIFLFLYNRTKENKKRHDARDPVCDKHGEVLQEHSKVLTIVTTNQKQMMKNQDRQDKKLDTISEQIFELKS